MFKIVKIGAVVVGVVGCLLVTPILASAAGNGTSSNCTGPGLENRWGNGGATGDCTGPCLGTGIAAGFGQSSQGVGPGLQNQWGKNAH